MAEEKEFIQCQEEVVMISHSWSLVVTCDHSWSLVVTRGHFLDTISRLCMQNNNFARASRFFVHFFAVTARLRRETS